MNDWKLRKIEYLGKQPYNEKFGMELHIFQYANYKNAFVSYPTHVIEVKQEEYVSAVKLFEKAQMEMYGRVLHPHDIVEAIVNGKGMNAKVIGLTNRKLFLSWPAIYLNQDAGKLLCTFKEMEKAYYEMGMGLKNWLKTTFKPKQKKVKEKNL